jgi:hypothetical protein
MLKATEQEHQHVLSYMSDQASDETVEFVQKVYSEQLHSLRHDIWDVHTNRERWWVITNPMNLYSQQQFPNMDLALTFHLGLCLRIPSSERQSFADLNIEPLVACWRTFQEATDALSQAEEVEDFQAIGMRCREALITLVHIAQDLIEISRSEDTPKRSDFRGWSGLVADVVLHGSSHRERRGLLKSSAENSWKFTNWLTHAREAHFNDAEASLASTELTLSLFTTALIRHIRGVPDRCPSCGSQRLSPERGFHTADPETIFERPVCQKCEWVGAPVIVSPSPNKCDKAAPDGECVIMDRPLRKFPFGRSQNEKDE